MADQETTPGISSSPDIASSYTTGSETPLHERPLSAPLQSVPLEKTASQLSQERRLTALRSLFEEDPADVSDIEDTSAPQSLQISEAEDRYLLPSSILPAIQNGTTSQNRKRHAGTTPTNSQRCYIFPQLTVDHPQKKAILGTLQTLRDRRYRIVIDTLQLRSKCCLMNRRYFFSSDPA